MPDQLKLIPHTQQEPTQFMTAEEYEVFWERLLEEVGPSLDAQREARRRSEERAMHHLVR